jgi:3-hydroxyacyl-CoA dehydrogenase
LTSVIYAEYFNDTHNQLAKASSDRISLLIAFLSPVEKMPLVEVIVGKKQAKKTLAAAIITAIGKSHYRK